jgi:hypothetical protein
MAERDRIVEQMKRAFEEDAWHGPSVMEVLGDVTWRKALEKPIPAAHSVWEIVLHMTAWEDVVRRRLLGESVSLTSEEDCPPSRTRARLAGTGRSMRSGRGTCVSARPPPGSRTNN